MAGVEQKWGRKIPLSMGCPAGFSLELDTVAQHLGRFHPAVLSLLISNTQMAQGDFRAWDAKLSVCDQVSQGPEGNPL